MACRRHSDINKPPLVKSGRKKISLKEITVAPDQALESCENPGLPQGKLHLFCFTEPQAPGLQVIHHGKQFYLMD